MRRSYLCLALVVVPMLLCQRPPVQWAFLTLDLFPSPPRRFAALDLCTMVSWSISTCLRSLTCIEAASRTTPYASPLIFAFTLALALELALHPHAPPRYNGWAGADTLSERVKELELIPCLRLRAASSDPLGRSVVLEAEPTHLIEQLPLRAERCEGETTADSADDVSAYEIALRSLEVTTMRLTFELDGESSLRCRLEVALRTQLPTAWFVPRVAVEAAGNLLLNVALRIGLEEMLGLLKHL